ncbi:MAG: glycosyltransferase family 2 protein [Patescibacteria group bacterium]
MKTFKVILILPAYNAAQTLEKTFKAIPEYFQKNVILVDDYSNDNTVSIAQRLGIETIVHSHNLGYGANQKTCYDAALKRDVDIIVMLHPDYQYDPQKIPELIQPIINGNADIVLGSRISNKQAVKNGMPFWKYVGNRFLTWMENFILHQNLSEYHTGYRAYSAKVLHSVKFSNNSDGFVFDSQVLIQSIVKKFRISEISVNAKYFKEASSIKLLTSIHYGILTSFCLLEYFFHVHGWKKISWLK